MPSYGQLDDEEAWQDEISAPGLVRLREMLLTHWPGAGIWIRGDNEHLRGYHRSRRWIKTSIYCTDRNYSVSRTIGDRSGGNENEACALDLGGIPPSELHATCQRLDAACRAGQLEKITEWYGNLGNDNIVDGWDNISNRPASSGSSHLTHLHMSFDRGRANEDHTDVFNILTGADMFNDADRRALGAMFNILVELRDGDTSQQVDVYPHAEGWLAEQVRQLSIPDPAPVDIPALVVALTPVIRSIIREELDDTKLGGIS